MKKKQLESFLQQLETFRRPRLELEQYSTSVQLGTSILTTINEMDGFEDALVGDLGCGCGVFMLGAIQFGAGFATGFDVDPDALQICRENIAETDSQAHCDLVRADLVLTDDADHSSAYFNEKFDIVVMNPPFGTKNNTGIDLKFVEHGMRLLRPGGVLYSLHKSSTRDYILRKGKREWKNICNEVECVAELRWNLEKTYRHQKQKSFDIAVDLFRFSKIA